MLRVLCVPKIESGLAEKLRRSIDPEGHGYFHILGLDTPREVVLEIERLSGRQRSLRSSRASPKALAHPTLIEQQLVHERQWARVAIAAAVLLGVGALAGAGANAVTSSEVRPMAPVIARQLMERRMEVSPAVEEGPVLSAIATPGSID